MNALMKLKVRNSKFKTISQISKVLRFLTIVLTFNICVLSLPLPVFAQVLHEAATTSAIPTTISPASPQFTDLLFNNVLHTFSCLTVGSSFIDQPCLTYQATKNAEGAIKTVPVLSQVDLSGGLLGTSASLITGLYLNQPIRTSEYIASLGKDFGVVKEAHAQVSGSGNSVLSPVLSLWQVSRNICYLIMILIFVIIGLMVIFRQKINPQTVVTAQAALPGLIIGLVLITFSYFLAALITDAAFVGVNLVGYYFSAAQQNANPKLVSDIAQDNVGSIFSKFVGMISKGDIEGVLQPIIDSLDGGVQAWVKLFGAVTAYQVGASVGGPIGALGGSVICGLAPAAATGGIAAPLGLLGAGVCSLIGGAIGPTVGGALFAAKAFLDPAGTFSWALYFIAIAIMIYTMFKLLLKLISNYVTIIFLTISAPFHFLAASLPGRQGIATNWILNMLCNVLSFPAVFGVFYFVAYLNGPGGWFSGPGQLFNISTPPFNPSGNQTLPLFGGLSLSFIRVLLAYGALVATPSIPDIICKTIGRVSQAGQMIGQEISGGTRSGQGYYGQTTGGIGKVSGNLSQLRETWTGGRVPGKGLADVVEGRKITLPDWLKKQNFGH